MKSPIITVNVIGTAVFTAVAVPAAFIDRQWSDVATIAVCMALFAVGTFGFLGSFPTAFERSRLDEIGAANLYMLTGGATSKDVKRVMLGALFAQVVVAFAVASVGISRQSNAHRLNPMAFAILVPMLGFGLNGLWAARHGTFGPRLSDARRTRRPVPDNDAEMEQNSSHG